MRVLAAADVHGEPGPGPRRRYVLLAALLLLALPVAAQDPDTVAGMDAAVRGDWAAACEAFAKVKGDPRSGLRLAAARKQAIARLGPAVDQLVRKRRWRQLAEAAACGLVVDPKYHRFTGAAKRLAKVGFAELPVVTARLRPWATYGLDFGDAELLVEGCLEFLVKTQEAEGHWDSGAHGGGELYDAGVTALALLALAPHHREAADRAAAALRRMQHERGYFGTMTTHSWVYNHAFATEALAEYALLTGTAAAHRDALQRAADFLLAAQNPGSGWRYEPRHRRRGRLRGRARVGPEHDRPELRGDRLQLPRRRGRTAGGQAGEVPPRVHPVDDRRRLRRLRPHGRRPRSARQELHAGARHAAPDEVPGPVLLGPRVTRVRRPARADPGGLVRGARQGGGGLPRRPRRHACLRRLGPRPTGSPARAR
ncbi:MAG: prenyltransferase/squalene oxidase repeat-containing protein [Planctomycetota bacterium]|jgi:hypothetical protein